MNEPVPNSTKLENLMAETLHLVSFRPKGAACNKNVCGEEEDGGELF